MLETARPPINLTKDEATREKASHNQHLGDTSDLKQSTDPERETADTKPDPDLINEKDQKPKNIKSTTSQPPLLILDLNGSLVYRKYKPSGPQIIPRPHLDELFNYAFDTCSKQESDHQTDQTLNQKQNQAQNWEVLIWSSAQRRNVDLMCQTIQVSKREPARSDQNAIRRRKAQTDVTKQLSDISNQFNNLNLGKVNDSDPPTSGTETLNKKKINRHVIDVWSREMLDLSSKDFHRKVSTTKDLRKVWNALFWIDPTTGQKLTWGPHNTLIVDDSPDKLSLQPGNLCVIGEFQGQSDDKALPQLIEKLKSLRNEPNIPEAIKKLESKS